MVVQIFLDEGPPLEFQAIETGWKNDISPANFFSNR